MGVEVEEVVALQELIGELGEGKAVAGLAVEALLHAVLSHHIVDRDMLADIAHEVEEAVVLHPVVVVHHLGLVGLCAVKVEEFGHLLLDALLIVIERVGVKQVALLALARRVADHAGSPAHEEEGLVAAALQVAEHHDAAQVAYVKRVGRRVGAQIGGYHFLLQ